MHLSNIMKVTIKNIYNINTKLTAYVCNKTVFVDETFLDKYSFNELEAVIAHELAHIKNKDRIYLSLSIFTLLSLVISINCMFNEINILNLIIITLFGSLVIYPIYVLISRWREYNADMTAIKYIEDPKALSQYFNSYIENMKKEGHLLPDHGNFAYKYLYTHPFIKDRIQSIENYSIKKSNGI